MYRVCATNPWKHVTCCERDHTLHRNNTCTSKKHHTEMLTLALYCYSSTAVQLAVQFFCWLRTLLWRQGSYMRQMMPSYRHMEPFLRYLWSKGQLSDSTGKGQTVDLPEDHLDRFFFFFPTPLFAGFLFCFFTICLHLTLSPARSTQPPPTKF